MGAGNGRHKNDGFLIEVQKGCVSSIGLPSGPAHLFIGAQFARTGQGVRLLQQCHQKKPEEVDGLGAVISGEVDRLGTLV